MWARSSLSSYLSSCSSPSLFRAAYNSAGLVPARSTILALHQLSWFALAADVRVAARVGSGGDAGAAGGGTRKIFCVLTLDKCVTARAHVIARAYVRPHGMCGRCV